MAELYLALVTLSPPTALRSGRPAPVSPGRLSPLACTVPALAAGFMSWAGMR